MLLIGQQHGDEPAGSEALLVIAQELAQGLLEPLLDQINVVIVPRANPDGAATGTRSTANGVDMNRDHLLLNTPRPRPWQSWPATTGPSWCSMPMNSPWQAAICRSSMPSSAMTSCCNMRPPPTSTSFDQGLERGGITRPCSRRSRTKD